MTQFMNGLIYIFTGDGKGKTSAALGTVTRAVCAGNKVAWVAWYKSKAWDISEKKLPEILSGVDFYLMGEGFFIKDHSFCQGFRGQAKSKIKPLKTGGKVFDTATETDHKLAAQKALEKAEKILTSQKYFLLVCDEIVNTLADGLLDLSDIKNLIKKRGQTHLFLTGRNAPQELIDQSDLVTEMKKVKHPYDKGIPAVKGLDF